MITQTKLKSFRVHLIKCPRCGFIIAVKNGHNNLGKQRYMCKGCFHQYIAERGQKPKCRVLKKRLDTTQ